jgi:hypothetical protein
MTLSAFGLREDARMALNRPFSTPAFGRPVDASQIGTPTASRYVAMTAPPIASNVVRSFDHEQNHILSAS